MIEVYDSKNTQYDKNGDMTLTPTTCELVAELNGEIRIELSHKYDELGRWKYLQEENVIACPAPWGDKQLFRIYKKVKQTREIVVSAYHIFYDLRHKTLIDKRPTDKNGEDALNIILAGTGYKGHSNISVITTAYYVRKNIVSAICGEDENSFLNRWGGEILPDNFDIYIYDRIGADRGVKARFGYNLKEIKETIDISNVVTRIIPVGYNGIMLPGEEPWVDSPNIEKYAQIYEQVVAYEDIKVKENDTETEGYATLKDAQAALRAAAQQDFASGVDEPTVNYIVDMALLENTEAYKQYKELSKVTLGDTVHCSHAKIDIDIEARCIKITWDCLRKRTKEIELGEYINTYFDEQRITNKELQKSTENTYTRDQVNEMINRYLDDTKNFITEEQLTKTLIAYVTKTLLDSTLSKYATLEAMKKEIQNATSGGITETSLQEVLSNYVSTEAMQEALSNYVSTEAMQEALSNYISTEAMQEKLNGYVGSAVYEEKINEIEGRLTKLGG